MHIAILGVGAIGGYLAVQLSNAPNISIDLLARSNYMHIKKNGLTLFNSHGKIETHQSNFTIERDITSLERKYDYIFICVLTSQTKSILYDIQRLCHKDTVIITLQNGLAFEEDLINALPNSPIYNGTCWIKVTKLEDNKIQHLFGNLIKLGSVSKQKSNSNHLIQLFNNSEIAVELIDDVTSAQLTKLALNIPIFVLMIKTGKTIGEILHNSYLDQERRVIQDEITAASKIINKSVDNDFIESIIDNLKSIDYTTENCSLEIIKRIKQDLLDGVNSLLTYFSNRNVDLILLKKEMTTLY